MKNTFKRFLALVMVLCTVAAWMIPGATAATTNGLATTYTLYDEAVAAGCGTSDVMISYCTGTVTPGAGQGTGYAPLKNAYDAGTADFMIDSGSLNLALKTYGKFGGGLLRVGTGSGYDTITKYFAIRIKAPATGEFELSAVYSAGSKMDKNIVRYAKGYVMEATEEPMTNYTYGSGSLNDYAAGKVSAGLEPLVAFNPYDATIAAQNGVLTSAPSNGNKVELEEGKEYFVVFGITNNGDNPELNYDDTAETFMYLRSFTLTQVLKTDYTLNYHANYEGAEVETVADNENVTGVYETEKTFTVDKIPFNRPASFAFRGWALEAEGEVVYQTDDEITLTNSAPTLDLYAIWEEVWDPANNTDLTVDFKADFTAAGVAKDAYLITKSNADLVDAAYASGTIKWGTVPSLHASATQTMVYMATANGGRFRAGEYLEVANSSKYQVNYPYAGVPLKFKAPGSGEYKLSFTYGCAAQVQNRGELIGVYINEMPETGTISKYTSFNPAGSLLSAVVENPGLSGSGASEGTVILEGGKEYLIVFFAYDSDYTTPAFANIRTFTLTEVKPEANIGNDRHKTVEEAVAAAVSGDTIKLNVDADVEALNLPNGVALDLNGKTLTAGAVTGTITDSADGAGLLAVAQDAAVIDSSSQLVLWDNTTDAQGYRVFNYTFVNYTGENDDSADNSFVHTAVNKTTTIWDGTNGSTVAATAATWFDNYVAETSDWYYQYCSNPYYANVGSYMDSGRQSLVLRSHANQNMAIHAIRFRSPGAGETEVTLTYGLYRGAEKADIYIIPASVVDSLLGDDLVAAQKALVEAVASHKTGDNEHYSAVNAAIKAAIAETTPVIDDLCYNTGTSGKDKTATGTYTFGDEAEYLMVFVPVEANASDYSYMLVESIGFDREATQGTIRTFWSHLKFTNSYAYTLVASGKTDLQAGFEMNWNGFDKTFQFDDATIAEWALAEEANVDTDYGFYIRMSGFEAAGEGILTAKPYIKVGTQTIYTSREMVYTTAGYVAE